MPSSDYKKSTGTTSAERFVAQMCQHSFLSLWNFSNPHTDDGKVVGNPTSVGKELCDQLIVFGSHVLILSDKDCTYTEHEDPYVNWARYYKKAVFKSAAQMWRAEKWLREFRSRLYEDAACHRPLRAVLPPVEQMKVHRILIVHGVAEACRKARGGSGSLAIDTQLVGEEHHDNKKYAVEPFTIGHVNPEKGFVHVFDEVALNEIMKSLDTITDFVQYLEKKEAFFSFGERRIYADGEEEMLAYYLRHLDSTGEHSFPSPGKGEVVFESGEWLEFINSAEWERREKANEISYTWDNMIEYITQHFEQNSMHFSTDKSFEANEKALRLMAQESRLNRRKLAESLYEVLNSTPSGQYRVRMLYSKGAPGVGFFLLIMPRDTAGGYAEYRRTRFKVLESYCRVAKLMCFGKLTHIAGIATDGRSTNKGNSIDFLYYEAHQWDPGERERAEHIQTVTGFLTNARTWEEEVDEYLD